MNADTFIQRAERVTGARPRRNGDGWTTYCPSHEADGRRHRASLSVSGDGDDLLLHCFAGCSFDAILATVSEPTDVLARQAEPEPRSTELLWEPSAFRRWFEGCVTTLLERPDAPGVSHARRYLRGRGITSNDCRRLGIGFHSPGVEPPPALSGEDRHDLDRTRYMITYSTGATSVEGRVVPDLYRHTHPFIRKHDLTKSYAAGPKRWWGAADATGDTVAIVEGWGDRIPLERCGIPTVAARGQGTKVEDVDALAHRGVTTAYLLLDATADLERIRTMAATLARRGITPRAMHGHRPETHPGDDLGDLCTLDDDALHEVVYGTGRWVGRGVLCDAVEVAA